MENMENMDVDCNEVGTLIADTELPPPVMLTLQDVLQKHRDKLNQRPLYCFLEEKKMIQYRIEFHRTRLEFIPVKSLYEQDMSIKIISLFDIQSMDRFPSKLVLVISLGQLQNIYMPSTEQLIDGIYKCINSFNYELMRGEIFHTIENCDEDEVCVVCLESLKGDVVHMKCCASNIHETCTVNFWLHTGSTKLGYKCPLCRTEICSSCYDCSPKAHRTLAVIT